jgi:hypothetical protein
VTAFLSPLATPAAPVTLYVNFGVYFEVIRSYKGRLSSTFGAFLMTGNRHSSDDQVGSAHHSGRSRAVLVPNDFMD